MEVCRDPDCIETPHWVGDSRCVSYVPPLETATGKDDDYQAYEWEALLSTNNERLLKLNEGGLALGGIDMHYLTVLCEYIVDNMHPQALDAMRLEQQRWLVGELDIAEEKLAKHLEEVAKRQEEMELEARRRSLSGQGPVKFPGRRG
jgi:hypothetical protein